MYGPNEHRREQLLTRGEEQVPDVAGESEQFVLPTDFLLDRLRHRFHFTPKLTHVKTVAQPQREQFVGDVQGHQNGDALVAEHLAGVAQVAHLIVEILDSFAQARLFLGLACDAVTALEDGDLDGVVVAAYRPSSGIRLTSAVKRLRAASIFSVSRRF